jgi:hypothetical protein
MAHGYTYQEDNAALEFNIPPQTSISGFNGAIISALSWLSTSLLGPKKLTTSTNVTLTLDGTTNRDPRAGAIGCSPDYDPYDSTLPRWQREPLGILALGNKRHAGGHIHIAYNTDRMPAYVAAQFLDLHLGLPCVAHDKQGARRKLYGLPGLHRPKAYGVEYRVLSNFWLWKSGTYRTYLANNAFTFANATYDDAKFDVLVNSYNSIPWTDVQKAITNEDAELASHLLTWLNRSIGLNITNLGEL